MRQVNRQHFQSFLAACLMIKITIQFKGENIMATMLIQHKVKSFREWKKEFDSAVELRKSNGELFTQVYQDASDPNMVTVVNSWNSLANAQKFAQSPELMAAMEKAGVLGAPSVSFLNEV